MPRQLGLDCVDCERDTWIAIFCSACRPTLACLGILSTIFLPNVITHRFMEQAIELIIDIGRLASQLLGRLEKRPEISGRSLGLVEDATGGKQEPNPEPV